MSQFGPIQPFNPPAAGGQAGQGKQPSRPPGEPGPQPQYLYREKQLGAPPVGPWASGAKQAWSTTRPFLVRHLQAAGQLETSLDHAAGAARSEYGSQVAAGSNPYQARASAVSSLNHLPGLGPEPAALPDKIRQVSQFHDLLNTGALLNPRSSQFPTPGRSAIPSGPPIPPPAPRPPTMSPTQRPGFAPTS